MLLEDRGSRFKFSEKIVKINTTIKKAIKNTKIQKTHIYLEFYREFKNKGYHILLLLNHS